MLILTRTEDETLELYVDGRPVTVTVVEVQRGKVRLGVTADADVTIYRGEVADAIRREGGDPSDPRSRRRLPR